VYFWTTTPSPRESSLASDGVVMYAFVQRALSAGSAVLGKTRQLAAGDVGDQDPASWNRLSSEESLSTEAAYQAGVYSHDDRLLAVNRPQAEDGAIPLANSRVAELFRGLDFVHVNDKAGSVMALIQEIWRMFLGSMLVALLLEAALCMPKTPKKLNAAEGSCGFASRSGIETTNGQSNGRAGGRPVERPAPRGIGV
jgi:hypothetical protein